MSSKISQSELESSIGAIYDDFHGDKGVGANWYRVWCLGSHGRQTASSAQPGGKYGRPECTKQQD
jgi:hypothetical protein